MKRSIPLDNSYSNPQSIKIMRGKDSKEKYTLPFCWTVVSWIGKVAMILSVPYMFISSPTQQLLDISHKIHREAFIISRITKNISLPIFPIHVSEHKASSKLNYGFFRNSVETQNSKNQSLMNVVRDLFIIGQSDPDRLIRILNETDPLDTKYSDPLDFQCSQDPNERLPRNINYTKIEHFKNHTLGYYVFFQHLRKAGGTSFCELARSNMIRKWTPPYYCMNDNKGSLATPPWDKEAYLAANIISHQYRVVANEWDVFYEYFLNYTGAIFATTIRNPLDRWYSQYRFEHLEHRDGSSQTAPRRPFFAWYKNNYAWTMGTDYYVKTFIGEVGTKDFLDKANKDDFYWTYHKFSNKKITWEQFSKAIDNFSHFSVILVLEWIQANSTQAMLEDMLGWKNPVKQVLPHEVQAIRKVKKSIPVHDVIPRDEYMFIARQNVNDLLFYEVARRMHLERIKCSYD